MAGFACGICKKPRGFASCADISRGISIDLLGSIDPPGIREVLGMALSRMSILPFLALACGLVKYLKNYILSGHVYVLGGLV